MKIEVMVPELCCLYGDKANMKYLHQCLPQAEFVSTGLNDKPAFLQEDVALCYFGSMSEQSQERMLSRLMPYKAEILECVRAGKTFFLLTGNALELFGSYIQREDGTKVEALGIFETYAVRQSPKRFNSLITASFENMVLQGYTSRFSHTFGVTDEIAFAHVQIGTGCCEGSKLEGVMLPNLVGTYLLGPLLVANPDFTHWLLSGMGCELEELPFESAMREAYNVKAAEFSAGDLVLD